MPRKALLLARENPPNCWLLQREASCRGKSPRLGGEALGSILGSAPTLHITLSMTMNLRPFLVLMCLGRGWPNQLKQSEDPFVIYLSLQ